MSLLLLSPDRNMEPYRNAMLQVDPDLDIEIWPGVSDKKRVHFIVAWNHPKHVLDSFPNLKAVSSLGAGVDHILSDEVLPKGIPVCRVVSPSLVEQMKEYVVCALLMLQRNMLAYFNQKRKAEWEVHPNKDKDNFIVGVMGLGELGRPIASHLASLGYRVHGWSRSAKQIEGVTSHAGKEELNNFLSSSKALVCLLPLTRETEQILDMDLFKKMIHPAYLINAARGEHLVEEDLIYALDKGWIEGAVLDVFSEEPLPQKHPFWNRDNILITPHSSSLTPPGDVAPQLVENYKRALSGMELLHQVDRERGY